MVDQRLHFDSGVLFPRLLLVARKIYMEHTSEIPQAYFDQIYEAFDFVEKFLELSEYVAGDNMTVADLCFVASITSMEYNCPISADKYPKITEWKDKMQKLPYYYEANGLGNEMRVKMFNNILENVKKGK